MASVDLQTADSGERKMTRSELVEYITDEAARRYGLTFDAFMAKVRAGDLDDCGGGADLVGFARLLPEGALEAA